MFGFTDKLWQSATVLLAMGCLMLGAWLTVTQAQLIKTAETLTSAEGDKAKLQADSSSLAAALADTERARLRAKSDAENMAALIKSGEQRRTKVLLRQRKLVEQATKLQESDDEKTPWADAVVPAEFGRLLQLAANCAQPGGDQNRVCTATKGADQPVSGANTTKGANQSRLAPIQPRSVGRAGTVQPRLADAQRLVSAAGAAP